MFKPPSLGREYDVGQQVRTTTRVATVIVCDGDSRVEAGGTIRGQRGVDEAASGGIRGLLLLAGAGEHYVLGAEWPW